MVIAVPKLHASQRRIVIIAWVTYAAYYLGRVNLATAIPDLQTDLNFTKSQVGLISTGFFWAYASGALVNGQLGDRISPRRFVLVGMLVSTGLNIAFGSLSLWIALFLLWTVNGYFQATGWGPILRILANWLTSAQQRKVSGIFGSNYVVGTAVTWLLSGWLIANFGWRSAFWFPAALMGLVAVLWYTIVRDVPEAPREATAPQQPSGGLLAQLSVPFIRLWSLILAGVFMGFCLVVLIIWMPTYYVEVGGLSIGPASSLAALLPFAGIVGTLAIGWFVGNHMADREVQGLTVLMVILAVLFIVYIFLPTNLTMMTVGLMTIGAFLYGASSLLLTTMSLVYGGHEHASGTAGLLDFSFNIGAGLSGSIIGLILDRWSWSTVFVTLAIAAGLAALFVLITLIRFTSRGTINDNTATGH